MTTWTWLACISLLSLAFRPSGQDSIDGGPGPVIAAHSTSRLLATEAVRSFSNVLEARMVIAAD